MCSARVLVVAGDEAIRATALDRVTATGLVHAEATGFDQAVQVGRLFKPEIVVMLIEDGNGGGEAAQRFAQSLRVELASQTFLVLGLIAPTVDAATELDIGRAFDDVLREPVHTKQLGDHLQRLMRLCRMQRESNRRWRTAQRFMQWNGQQPHGLDLVSESDEEGTLVPRVALWAANAGDDRAATTLRERLHAAAIVRPCGSDDEVFQTLLTGDAEVCLISADPSLEQVLNFASAARNSATLFNIPIIVCVGKAAQADIDRLFKAGVSDILIGVPSSDELRACLLGLLRLEQFRRGLTESFQSTTETQIRDSVTGLYTYGFGMDYVSQLIVDSKERQRAFSIAVGTIDNLSQINGGQGYIAGDYALRRIAQLMERALRVEDLVARYSGSRIMIVFPDTELPRARIALGRLANIMRYTSLEMPGNLPSVAVEISFREVQWSGQAGVDELLANLDTARSAAA